MSQGAFHLPLLSETIPTKSFISPRKVIPRKSCENDVDPTEYWFHNNIHTFGNTNILGGLHAAMAPVATRLIDELAYNGIDVRSVIARDLYQIVNKTKACILDLCCGVGMSTRCLASSFQDAEYICGIDTSPEMISMARFITQYNSFLSEIKDTFCQHQQSSNKDLHSAEEPLTHPTVNCAYAIGNSERVKAPKGHFDLVTIFFAFHEIPYSARSRIIRESRRLLKPGGRLAIIDICPVNYIPSPSMLSGEPYILEYQKNIQKQIAKAQGFQTTEMTHVIPGHVVAWMLTRSGGDAPFGSEHQLQSLGSP